jgi:hypothetical protein
VTSERALETLTAEDFRSQQGTKFRLTGKTAEGGSADPFEVELADITEHVAGAPGAFRTPFSVVFRGPLHPVMPQGIYHVEHEHLGALEIFIVPIGPDTDSASGEGPAAMLYEAVFA